MAVFSSQPLKKIFFFQIFVKVTPPPRKSQNVKMRNFCNGFEKVMLSTLKKLKKKNYSILNLGEFFHGEKYRVFTQYAAATIMRHWATMS